MADFKVLPPKHPTSRLDYLFDWAQKTNNRGLTDWLEEDEKIDTYNIVASDGITVDNHTKIDSDTAILVWLSGGTNSVEYKVSCTIHTDKQREDTRSIIVPVKLR